ncbi:ribose transport system substrate-binding protein [Natronincola peptidivorans]|uniref:Ribose transport system substrate-binding protein n=1 Tax=Natronincola peptidivorans TaxID=426128 RepID=A0A1I0E645_9FIRM|nr:ABC transporter substrate-binding protein [Natronincola peptidivorans]SET40626.1 ribose transport system substrate-binding protein [Natronincola peptidivorans]
MKKSICALLILLLTIGVLAGCSTNNGGNDTVSEGEDNEKINIAVIVKGTDIPYFQVVNSGAEAAAAELGVDMYFAGAPGGETDINGQINIVETAINQRVDGIVIAASDATSLAPVLNNAVDQGIPVALVDSGVEMDRYISYATTNNEAAAYAVGGALGEIIGGQGKVGVVNFTAGAATAIAREKGFRDAIEELYPDIQLLETQYSNADRSRALSIAEDLLTAHPDLVAIYAANEPTVVGVGRALEERGSDVVLVGFDSSDDIIPLLEKGILRATAVQMPYQMGYAGIEEIVKHIRGEAVTRELDTGVVIVTPENMSDKESQDALYPLGK